MSLYSAPPPYRDSVSDKPTLLVCWWITIFCATIILVRICGRFVRSETLFREDKIAALALIPLFARMGCVHIILIHGTNNANFEGVFMTDQQLRMKSMASGLVLLSRIFYAATLWVLKTAILEFFRRLTGVPWERSYVIALTFIRILLALTFVAVVISDVTECRPFANYWQVLPDPGGQCRQGYAQLLTMAVCNVMTDLCLVFFPIPIILRSYMTVKRKAQLVSLFSLSLAVVGVTLYRVPHIFRTEGSQQLRSLLASVELLFATAVSNALVMGTFVRDRGVKKRRFKYGSVIEPERASESRSRRPTVVRHWGSDEDLVRDLGLGVVPELRDPPESPATASSPFSQSAPMVKIPGDMDHWQFPDRRISGGPRSDDSLLQRDQLHLSRSNSTATPRRVSFFDVGGLLDPEDQRSISGYGSSVGRRDSYLSSIDPIAPSLQASTTGSRRGSTAVLQDLGSLLGSLRPSQSQRSNKSRSTNHVTAGTELAPIPQEPKYESSCSNDDGIRQEPVLNDVGGLLDPRKEYLVK